MWGEMQLSCLRAYQVWLDQEPRRVLLLQACFATSSSCLLTGHLSEANHEAKLHFTLRKARMRGMTWGMELQRQQHTPMPEKAEMRHSWTA